MFFKAKQAAQPFVKKGSLGYMPQQWKNRRAWMGGLQVLVVQRDPKNDENIHKKCWFSILIFVPKNLWKNIDFRNP